MVKKSRKSREEWKIYKNVFDQFTERLIFKLITEGHFERLSIPIALGKEANIFLGETKTGENVIVKIYRLENCNFNKMYYYISSDPRFIGLENQKRKVVFSWVQREYRNLLLAREKIRVPTPLTFKHNVLVMEHIGEDDRSCLQLKNADVNNYEEMSEKIIKNMEKLIETGIIHGDLSEFNILVQNQEPIFIDFSQAMPVETIDGAEYLKRDIKNVVRYFKKVGVKLDQEEIETKLVKKLIEKIGEK